VQVLAFIDNFDGTSLGSWWTVLHENTSTYSVSGGQLHTKTMPGDLAYWDNDYTNLFLINNPYAGQDFVATMKVLNFTPTSNFQQIDIVAYDNLYNHVRAINGWVWGNRNWQFVYGVGSSYLEAGREAMNPVAEDFYLRLTKTGNVYRQYYSYDGITFTQLNGAITYGNGSPAYLGIVGLQSEQYQTPVSVDIDYFAVQAVPLPGAVWLLGSGLLGLAGWRRFKKG